MSVNNDPNPSVSSQDTPATDPAAPNGRPLVLIGGGGHAKVVAEAAEAAGYHIVGFLDDAESTSLGARGLNHLGPIDSWDSFDEETALFIAIGDNALRAKVLSRIIESLGDAAYARLVPVVHPSAEISVSANIGSGVFVGPRAVVNADATIEPGVIINTGAIVEHDNQIGTSAHIAPGTVLGGHVTVGAETLVGLGARVRPEIEIGSHAVIGAGAVVVSNVPEGATVRGVPARE